MRAEQPPPWGVLPDDPDDDQEFEQPEQHDGESPLKRRPATEIIDQYHRDVITRRRLYGR